VFVFQHDVCSLPPNDSMAAAYTDPPVFKISSSGSKRSHDCRNSTVSTYNLSALMASPVACSSSVHSVQRQPKRQSSYVDEEQENFNPAAVCSSVPATSQLVGFDEAHSLCRSPVSKRQCRKNTDSDAKKKNGSVEDLVKGENSRVAMSSRKYGNSEGLSDVEIKSALNRSDDRLHELIGDFSRAYCLPFIEDNKHRDLKAISCHTVSSDYFIDLVEHFS